MSRQRPTVLRKLTKTTESADLVPIADGVMMPSQTTATITYAGEDGWTMEVVGRVEVIDGVPELVDVGFRALDGLPLSRLQREWSWQWLLDQIVGLHAHGREGVDDPRVQAVKALQRSRTTRLNPKHLRRVARIYRKHEDSEPVKHVAAELDANYATARRWCHEARHRNDPATGRPYLELTR